jgi:hypothetical protein
MYFIQTKIYTKNLIEINQLTFNKHINNQVNLFLPLLNKL